MCCWTFRRASRTARSNWRSHSRIAGWVCTPTTRPSTPATSNTRSLPGPSSATYTTACTIIWWRCSSRRRRTGSSAHDSGRRTSGGGDPAQRSDSIPALHGSGPLPSGIRLLPARAGSVRQTRRLFHGGTDPASLRHSDGGADSPSLPPDGLSARVYGGRTGSGTARDGGGIRRVELRAGGYRFGCHARKLCRRCFLQRVLRRASGGCRGVSERRFPRTTRRAGGRRVPLAHRRSGWSSRGPLPAPLLPASRGRPLVRSEPVGVGLAPAYGGGVDQRIRAQRRLRFHARRKRAISGGHADGIPAAHGARRRAGRSRAARHHVTREFHRAPRERRRVWARERALRDAGADAAGCRRARSVLAEAGLRDITSHVNFTALRESGAACGLENERFETLARTLLAAGEPDRFAVALGAGGAAEDLRRRMQLKTLLFGMGETFQVLLQRKTEGGDGGENRKEKP